MSEAKQHEQKKPDDDARDRIVDDLESTIFVQAAAGSGKTTSLVDRILKLVDDGVEIRHIAAITFTDRAAGELRDRTRRALRDSLTQDEDLRPLREQALLDIDDSAIGTLHGFALRLLAEFPIEAGLPLTFGVSDQIASEIAGDARWDQRAAELVDREELTEDFEVVRAAGINFDKLRELGESLDSQWDSVTPELFAMPGKADASAIVEPFIDELGELCSHINECSDDEDGLLRKIVDELAPYRQELEAATGDPAALVQILARAKPTMKLGIGRKPNWEDIEKVREHSEPLEKQHDAAKRALFETSVRRIVCAMAEDVRESAEARTAAGELSYDDLLVLARRLLVNNPGGEVRAALHDRYRRILVDEFQDTDPHQLAIVLRLTAAPEVELPIEELRPLPGRMFSVGDPLQSIYRFRGADLALYMEASARLTKGKDAPGRLETLTTNFRSAEPVVEWINKTFDGLIEEREHSQPSFTKLVPNRQDENLRGPAVLQLGSEAHTPGLKIGEVREREGAEIATTIAACVGVDGEPWQILRGGKKQDATLSDITILLSRRTALPQISAALDDANIPYRTESSGIAYASAEVRDLITVLGALNDQDDELALVKSLRSPLFGCSDSELLAYRNEFADGRWRIRQAKDGEPLENPVVESIDYLAGLAREAALIPPAALLERIARERGVFELAQTSSRPRDIWRRVRFVIDHARAWSESGGGSLGEYIAWAERQMDDDVRVDEAILPETDDDAVRLMTTHAAKGLEFPIVICAGLGNMTPKGKKDCEIEARGDAWDFHISSKWHSVGWGERHAGSKELEWDEMLRLLYVACTRACDHLIVSTHRQGTQSGNKDDLAWRLARAIESAGEDDPTLTSTEVPSVVATYERPGRVGPKSLPETKAWASERDQALQRAAEPRAKAVTALVREGEGEGEGEGDDSDEQLLGGPAAEPVAGSTAATEPARRTHGGKPFGNAVHEVLGLLDLGDLDAARAAVPALAQSRCFIEGVEEDCAAVEALVLGALGSEPIETIGEGRHWREFYVSEVVDGVVHEGVIDLMYESDDGLVIVDYKTDRVTEAGFSAHASDYAKQVLEYAGLIERTSGQKVARCVLLHLREDGATAVEVNRPA